MLFEVMMLCLGLLGLVFGADLLVKGAIGLAKYHKWPTLWVGTILVGFATTLPEMIVSLIAVLHGHPHIAIGNALGSYVANIGMVLGITAMICPMIIHKKILKRELPLLSAAMVLLLVLLSDFNLSIQDGIILLLALGAFIWLVSQNRETIQAIGEMPDVVISAKKAATIFFIGSIIIWGAGDILVIYASKIAKILGMSDWAIGLTIVAVGTSLPELAASIVSAKQGHHDLAIGNVVGSNIMGLLGVVAIPSILSPGNLPKSVIYQDIGAMTVVTIALWLTSIKSKENISEISRLEGFILFILFLSYLILTVK